MKERYYLKKTNEEKIYFEFNYGGLMKARKYIAEHEDELEHPFNDDRVTIYYEEVKEENKLRCSYCTNEMSEQEQKIYGMCQDCWDNGVE